MEPAEGMLSMNRTDAKDTLGLPRALISAPALLHNVALLRRHLRPGTKICAIIKADAYGHDASLVCNLLSQPLPPAEPSAASPAGLLDDTASLGDPPVDALAVASIDEAAVLPATPLPLLVLRPVENTYLAGERDRLELAIREGWTLTVCSAAAADDVARIAMAIERRASIQVMLDTGMTRADADIAALADLVATVGSHPSLRLAGLCTHFACSEAAADPFNAEQLRRFTQALAALPRPRGSARAPLLHTANSGAIFFHPDAHLDMVRPGLSLYGIDPTPAPSMDRPLRPVMKWTAPLLMIRQAPKGTGVGYGQTWQAPRDSRIGIVPVGYADGYLRSFSSRAKMIVNNRPVPVVGRVSMDVTAIDLTDVPSATLGDEVTILDNDPLSPASVYELARLADTIPYEIFCRIGPRIRRVLDRHDPVLTPRRRPGDHATRL
jgi:alanine racemase